VVYDSLAGAPLGGALVQAANAADLGDVRTTTADSLGNYRLAGLRAGRWVVGFVHPTLDALGLEMPTAAVQLGAAPFDLPLGIPGPRALHRVLCGSAATDSTGGLAGVVRDAESGSPMERAVVTVAWTELVIGQGGLRQERRRLTARTRPDGGFIFCGLPVDDRLSVSAEWRLQAPGDTAAAGSAPAAAPGTTASADSAHAARSVHRTGTLLVQPMRGGVVRTDLALGEPPTVAAAAADTVPAAPATPPARRTRGTTTAAAPVAREPRLVGPARLTGTVVDDRGRPLARARVVVLGAGAQAETSEAGTFRLDSLPTGSWTVEARALGFVPQQTMAALSRARPATVTLRMATPVNTLSSVVVYGERTRRVRLIDEIFERRRSGFARVLLAEEIARRSPIVVSDALRMTPGVRLVSTNGLGNAIRVRGCAPQVVLDGMPVLGGANDIDTLVQPSEVMAIEVYTMAGTAPPQYAGLGSDGCGAIMVWTWR
jgi:hypothetical protein